MQSLARKRSSLSTTLALVGGSTAFAAASQAASDSFIVAVLPDQYELVDHGLAVFTLETGEKVSLTADQYVVLSDGLLLIADEIAQASFAELPVLGSVRPSSLEDHAVFLSASADPMEVSATASQSSDDADQHRVFESLDLDRYELAQNNEQSNAENSGFSTAQTTTSGLAAAGSTLASLALMFASSGEEEADTPTEEPLGPTGVYLVKDINPNGDSTPISGRTKFSPLGDELFFIANDGTHGIELWRTDGTENGTSLLKDINDNPASADSWPLAVKVGDKLFFKADDGQNGVELWVTDGTEAGTVLVKNIHPSSDGLTTEIDDFAVEFNGNLLFGADDGTATGHELWISDGTDTGTLLLYDINQTTPGADTEISFVGQINGLQLLSANMGANGTQLWVTDGSANGTELLKDIEPADGVLLGDKFYFAADEGGSGYELWVTDGTSVGTTMLKDINVAQGQGSDPHEFRVANGLVFFGADDGTGAGNGLWVTDGTSSGTILLREFEPLQPGVTVDEGVEFDGLLYFVADDGVNGEQMWVSDGTENGTRMVPNDLENEWDLSTALGSLYFKAEDGFSGIELWVTDGSVEGTYLTADINPTGNSFPGSYTEFNDRLFFVADDGVHGWELWAIA